MAGERAGRLRAETGGLAARAVGGWLNEDMSVECFVGEHLSAAYLAAAILVGYGLGLPLFLIIKVRGPAGTYPLCKIIC